MLGFVIIVLFLFLMGWMVPALWIVLAVLIVIWLVAKVFR
jgi:hypothetical protein